MEEEEANLAGKEELRVNEEESPHSATGSPSSRRSSPRKRPMGTDRKPTKDLNDETEIVKRRKLDEDDRDRDATEGEEEWDYAEESETESEEEEGDDGQRVRPRYCEVMAELKVVRKEQAAVNKKLNFIMDMLIKKRKKNGNEIRNKRNVPKRTGSDISDDNERCSSSSSFGESDVEGDSFGRDSNIYNVIPLKTVEDIEKYFGIKRFCSAAKRVLDIRCDKGKKMVEQFFGLFFTDEVLTKVHWPSARASRVGATPDGTRRSQMPQPFVHFWTRSTRDIGKTFPTKAVMLATRSYVNNRSSRTLLKLPQLPPAEDLTEDDVGPPLSEIEAAAIDERNIYKYLPLGSVREINRHFRVDSFCSAAHKIVRLKCEKSVRMIKQFFGIFFTKDVLHKMFWPSRKATRVGQLSDGSKRIPFPSSFISFWNSAADGFSDVVQPRVMEKELRRFLLRSRKFEKRAELHDACTSAVSSSAWELPSTSPTKMEDHEAPGQTTFHFKEGSNIYNFLPLDEVEKIDQYFRIESFRNTAKRVMRTRCANNKKVVEDFFALFFTNQVLAVLFWPSSRASRVGFLPDGSRRRPFPQPFVDFWTEATAKIAATLPANELNSTTRHLITNRNAHAAKSADCSLAPSEGTSSGDKQHGLLCSFPPGTNIYTLLPLRSLESVEQYFRIESFCAEAKKVMRVKWEMDVDVVQGFFTFFFSEDVLIRSLLPSNKYSRVTQLSDGTKKEYLPPSFLKFWLDATDDIAATLPPKTLDKSVRKFLDSHRKHLQKKKANGSRRSAKKWPAEALNLTVTPPQLGISGDDDRSNVKPMTFEETNYLSSILPLKSIEEIHNYFRMDYFCALARTLMSMTCHNDIRMVDEAFGLFFTEELMAKLHWPSTSANYGKPEDGVRRVSFPQCFVDFWNNASKDIAGKLPPNVFQKTTRLYLNEVKNRIDTRLRRLGIRKPKPAPLPGSASKKRRKRRTRTMKATATVKRGKESSSPIGRRRISEGAATVEATAVSLEQVLPGQTAVMFVPCTMFGQADQEAVTESLERTALPNDGHPLAPAVEEASAHHPQWEDNKEEAQFMQCGSALSP